MTALDAAGDHHPGYGPMRSTGEHASAASQSLGFILIIVTVYRVDRTQYRGRSRNDSQ